VCVSVCQCVGVSVCNSSDVEAPPTSSAQAPPLSIWKNGNFFHFSSFTNRPIISDSWLAGKLATLPFFLSFFRFLSGWLLFVCLCCPLLLLLVVVVVVAHLDGSLWLTEWCHFSVIFMTRVWHYSDHSWNFLNRGPKMMSFLWHVSDTILTIRGIFSTGGQKWCHFYDIFMTRFWHCFDILLNFSDDPKWCHFHDTFLTRFWHVSDILLNFPN